MLAPRPRLLAFAAALGWSLACGTGSLSSDGPEVAPEGPEARARAADAVVALLTDVRAPIGELSGCGDLDRDATRPLGEAVRDFASTSDLRQGRCEGEARRRCQLELQKRHGEDRAVRIRFLVDGDEVVTSSVRCKLGR